MAAFVGVGNIISSTNDVRWVPDKSSNEGVLMVRGLLGTARWWVDQNLPYELTRRSFNVVAHDLGGQATWGNATGVSAMETVVTWMKARYDKVHVVAVSMGATDYLNFARRNLGEVDSAVLIGPVVKLGALHDRDETLDDSIEAAYTDLAGFLAELPVRDPYLWAGKFPNAPLQVWYSNTDETVLPSDVSDFCWDEGVRPLKQGNVGHSTDGVDPDVVADHMWGS